VRHLLLLTVGVACLAVSAIGASAQPDTGEAQFRSIYKELVETNTSLSVGDCTLAAQRMSDHLKAAGFPESDLHPFSVPDHPKEGGLVAVYPGRDPKAKAILLLAHIDVVEAKREEWTRDPFTLIEEDGSFYARGSVDDKAQAAMWVDTLIRYKTQNLRLKRTIKLALTCGEESGSSAFNGAAWLAKNQHDLIDAAFALNEGGNGEFDEKGSRVALEIEDGEKTYQDYRLEVTNKGGHSSRPVKDNAIYRLATALKRVEGFEFPAQFTDGSRAYFAAMAKVQASKGDSEGANAMTAVLHDPPDPAALALLSARDPTWNSTLRTTCVATMLQGGHAPNALPQRAWANVNCRIFPGVAQEQVRAQLESVISDAQVKITALNPEAVNPAPPPLTDEVLAPVKKITAQMWPGVPVVPIMQPGATDGRWLTAAGIPTYGIEPLFVGPDLGNIHGLNEHVSVQSLMECREFLYRLVQTYAGH
jgi:acetylornithine deacetylase/succinyl-diaminopimelate desuccinylase-like protein